ncbi:RNA polymerase sigma factor [Chryseobacterium sp.]|uniref:RNA polymerase sigma factor n=1 Tax=Chryseobacterium sp. TaxID=1871047 RepID=UPI0011C80D57|nr:sigma-70 family RNA polymerase sigma factor [Chryseobacterium sp.]TXF79343.1 sigma-70 family RNA polymerase sigma factor [Chryseobacterium sp.]
MQNKDWNHIYTQLSPKLLGVCRRYVADVYAAEDILQESFITAIQNVHQLKDDKNISGWLKKIVINNALQFLKKTAKTQFVSIETQQIPAMSDNNSTAFEQNEVLAYDFSSEELLASIDQLPFLQKSVFNMYFIDHYSHSDICKHLDINLNTSKSHLLRAKKSIRHYLLESRSSSTEQKRRKKGVLLLVFLGFGNLVWAQMYRNKLSALRIHPQRPTLSENFGNIPYEVKKHQQKPSIKAVAFLVLIFTVFSSLFFFNKINTQSTKTTVNAPVKIENDIKPAKQINEKFPSEIAEIKTSENFDITETPAKKSVKIAEKVPSKEPTQNTLFAASPFSDQEKAVEIIPISDTMQAKQRNKVIIVKKIIKRETIFIKKNK